MAYELRKDADRVIEAAAPIGKRRQGALAGSMSAFERLALSKLAQAARDDTRLAWPSQPTIAAYAGCSKNAIGPALQALEDAGHISTMPGRTGRFAVYLVHPGGRGSIAPLSAEAVKAHLARGKFDNGSREAVLIWLAQLGLIPGGAAIQALCRNMGRALSAQRITTPTAGGVMVDGATSAATTPTDGGVPEPHPSLSDRRPPNGWDEPSQRLGNTLPMVGAESEKEPEKESSAAASKARAPLPPTERQVVPVPPAATEAQCGELQVTAGDIRTLIDAAAPIGQAISAPRATRQSRIDYSGTATEFLQRLLEGGGDYAAKAQAVPEGDRLEWAAKQQQLHRGRSSNVRAAA